MLGAAAFQQGRDEGKFSGRDSFKAKGNFQNNPQRNPEQEQACYFSLQQKYWKRDCLYMHIHTCNIYFYK